MNMHESVNINMSFRQNQGIINCKEMETFAKEPKLAKALRELKSTLVSYNKNVRWFLSHGCNGKRAAFWMFFFAE